MTRAGPRRRAGRALARRAGRRRSPAGRRGRPGAGAVRARRGSARPKATTAGPRPRRSPAAFVQRRRLDVLASRATRSRSRPTRPRTCAAASGSRSAGPAPSPAAAGPATRTARTGSSRSTRSSSCSAAASTTRRCPPAKQLAPGDLLDRVGRAALPDHPVRRRGGLDPRPRTPTPADKERVSGIDAVPDGRGVPDRRHRPVLHPADAVRRRQRHASTRPATPTTCRPRRRSARRSRRPRSPRSPTPTAPARCSSRCAATSRTSRSAATHKVACSIVVIPIVGPQLRPAGRARRPRADKACRKGGQFPPGSSNFANEGVDQAVSPVAVVVGVQLAQPVLDPDHLRPAAGHLRHPRPAAADRLLRLRAARPGGAAVVAGVLPGQEALQVPAQPDVRRGRLEPDGERRRRRRRGLLGARPARQPTRSATRRPRSPASRSATSIDRPDNAGEYTDLQAQRAADRQAADPVLPRAPTSAAATRASGTTRWRS